MIRWEEIWTFHSQQITFELAKWCKSKYREWNLTHQTQQTKTLEKIWYNDEQFWTTRYESLRKLVYKQRNKSVIDEMQKEVPVNHVDVLSPNQVASNSQPVTVEMLDEVPVNHVDVLSPDQVVSNSQVVTAKRRRPNTCLPLGDIRFDGHGHWPKWTGNKERCKGDGCKGMSRVMCLKCKVHLCFHKAQDCFSPFSRSLSLQSFMAWVIELSSSTAPYVWVI